MALNLAEIMREARSVPNFNGTSEYSIINFLRDINMIISLTTPDNSAIVQSILANKIQGKALQVIDALHNPSFEQVLQKLKEEFGIKCNFISLRNEAMRVNANNLIDLHKKLSTILNKMNTKFSLEDREDALYNPVSNNKMIFDIYLNFLPFNVKTLLLQNEFKTIDEANTYYIENNILHEIELNNGMKSNLQAMNSEKNLNSRQRNYTFRNKFEHQNYGFNYGGNAGNGEMRNRNFYNNANNNQRWTNNFSDNHNHRLNNNFSNNLYNNQRPLYRNVGNSFSNNRNPFRNVDVRNGQNLRDNGNDNRSNFKQHHEINRSNNYSNNRNVESMDVGSLEVVDNFMSFSDDCQLPLIKVNIEGIKMDCLIDSGSATTIGDINTFKKFTLRKNLAKPLLLKTLSGTSKVFEEVLVNVPFEFNLPGEMMSVKLVDMENKSFKCILGINILSSLGVLLDFSKNIIKIKDKIISFSTIRANNLNHSHEDQAIYFPNYAVDSMCDALEIDKVEISTLEKSEFDIDKLISQDLNVEEESAIRNFLNKHKFLFYQEGQYLSATKCVKHQIVTTLHRPVYTKNYKYPYNLENEINDQINSMLENGIIRHSNSPYNSPLWIVPKKTDNSNIQKWRIVVDYRKLNAVTIDDKFPSKKMVILHF